MTGCSKYADVISAETYLDTRFRESCNKYDKELELFNSGIFDESTEYDALAQREGYAFQDQFTNDLEHASDHNFDGTVTGNTGVSYVPDLTKEDCTPCQTPTRSSERWTKHYREVCFTDKNLNKMVLSCTTGADDGTIILNGISNWWAKELQRIAFLQMLGIINHDLAEAEQKITLDACATPVTVGCGTNATAYSYLSEQVIAELDSFSGIDTDDYTGIIIHKSQKSELKKNKLLDRCCEETQEGNKFSFDEFYGMRVITSNNPALIIGAPADGKFLSIPFKQNAIALGRGCAPMPYYPDYDKCNRQHCHTFQEEFLMHSKGVCENYRKDQLEIPTDADLIDPTKYKIGVDSSCVGFAGIITCCA